MEGIGLLVVIAFVLLTFAIVSNSCSKEGFATPPPKQTVLDTKKEPKGYTNTADLPSAPVYGLAEANSLPFQDPALVKADFAILNELLKDMDGFASFEMPGLDNRSDPAVKLPLTRFKGDYQRIKDEVRVIQANKGLQSQLTLDDIFTMAANLRFLQRTYRLYANSDMVPQPKGNMSKVGIVEGFADPSTSTPITKEELNDLKTKLTVEITRLQASGTTDPVLQARVNVFTKMLQSVTDLVNRVNDGTLAVGDIPIMKADYENFLPSLTNSSSPIGNLITNSGNKSLGSLFNQYEAGDVSGKELAGSLFEKYADEFVKGVSFTYTSPRQVELKKEEQQKEKLNSRGEFDAKIKEEEQKFIGGRPQLQQSTQIGSFDWKKKVEDITMNIRRANLNPDDFGAISSGTSVGPDFSWRGHAKMMCSRLSTHLDPGIPEQMGCPPVSWKGWRI